MVDVVPVAQTPLVNPEFGPVINDFLSQNGKTSDQLSALPLYCRYDVLSLVLDRESGEILDTIDIDHEQLISSLSWRRLQEAGELPQ